MKLEKAKERKYSTVLHRYKVSGSDLISRVDGFLFDELVAHYDLNGQRKSAASKLRHHLNFFVTNLYAVSRGDPAKFIAFPKNRSVYSNPKSKVKKDYKLSFRYSVERGKAGKGVIPFLEHHRYTLNGR
ncbi:MAG: hypothetical protein WAL90_17780 [Desulfobacterales bacterium]